MKNTHHSAPHSFLRLVQYNKKYMAAVLNDTIN